ncbi:hypothetical protein G5714_021458 [Onychostoma macrolepis]|uniref:Uncharacterized protein n=1 Tax=Onychostoma macrolepis TaxID=369639 RepID=A0A7J6BR05_9TELE|nr:hypothetical protein G5714_021458 [Onychostoma macrolepis]
MDYWIRLNKAVDVAEECLKRQGRNLEGPSKDVTMMFVKHCPDPALSAVLKFKTADKWKASEIQERLDDHQTQLKIQQQWARSKHSGVERYATANVQAAAIDESTQSRASPSLRKHGSSGAALQVFPGNEPARVEELRRTSVLFVDALYERIRPASKATAMKHQERHEQASHPETDNS